MLSNYIQILLTGYDSDGKLANQVVTQGLGACIIHPLVFCQRANFGLGVLGGLSTTAAKLVHIKPSFKYQKHTYG
jgi:hypothetical protein